MLTANKNILLYFLLFISTVINAQVNLEWARTYSNGAIDSNMLAEDMAIDRNGNIYVTGAGIDSLQNVRIVTIKYSPNGNVEWVQRYNKADSTYCRSWSIHLDDSANVYIAGEESALLTLKYNTNGVLQWSRKYGNSNGYNGAWDITTDDSGYVYTTGQSTDKFVTMKYNRDGNLQWLALDSFTGGSGPTFITLDSIGNVYVTGRGNNHATACTTFKYNNAGAKQWVQYYSGLTANGFAAPVGIAIDNHGDIVIGAAIATTIGSGYFAAIKYSPNGTFHWATAYIDSFKYYNYPKSFILDKNGNSFITGGVNNWNSPTDAYGTIKINSNGIVQWNKEYAIDPNNLDMAYDVAVDKYGFIYVTGESGGGSSARDIVIVKYDQQGNQLMAERFLNSLNEEGYKIAVNDNSDIYVFGVQFEKSGEPSYILLKYSQRANGIQEKTKQVRWLVYPNPTTQNAILEFDNSSGNDFKLTLYNTYGQEVRTITDINKAKIEIEKQELSNGIYFFQLETASQIIAKGKLIFK